ncbi:MAG: M28 family peptidase [Chloroflexi bacterium]|nr:M28 family peptidase [Chloroflexota bacterium]MBI3167948.1 M28 family peptidase [Chloroflexota bacterium]
MNKRAVVLYLSIINGLLLLVTGWYAASFLTFGSAFESFDGSRAYTDVQTQVDMGPRTPGSAGHAQIREWMRKELESAGWIVEVHESQRLGHPIYNVFAKRGDEPPQIILAAHYDTRFVADHDPDPAKQTESVPGANDGASGVSVLLELARTLPDDTVPTWLVFFDAEDNGRVDGWDWIMGSRAFVEEISVQPQAVVILDMIGDADLNLYYEMNSDQTIRAEIWNKAAELGYGNVFIQDEKHSMLDDHTPFLEKGIPAVDIIDFDYPYWHTTEDTADKVSPESLHAVGDTLWHWVVERSEK